MNEADFEEQEHFYSLWCRKTEAEAKIWFEDGVWKMQTIAKNIFAKNEILVDMEFINGFWV